KNPREPARVPAHSQFHYYPARRNWRRIRLLNRGHLDPVHVINIALCRQQAKIHRDLLPRFFASSSLAISLLPRLAVGELVLHKLAVAIPQAELGGVTAGAPVIGTRSLAPCVGEREQNQRPSGLRQDDDGENRVPGHHCLLLANSASRPGYASRSFSRKARSLAISSLGEYSLPSFGSGSMIVQNTEYQTLRTSTFRESVVSVIWSRPFPRSRRAARRGARLCA